MQQPVDTQQQEVNMGTHLVGAAGVVAHGSTGDGHGSATGLDMPRSTPNPTLGIGNSNITSNSCSSCSSSNVARNCDNSNRHNINVDSSTINTHIPSSSSPNPASSSVTGSTSTSSRILFLIVTSGADEGDRSSETAVPRGNRYTRDSTRSLLQLLGIKPRIAYKIMTAVFAGLEAATAAGSRQRGQARRPYSVHKHGDGVCVGLTRADFAALISGCAAEFGYRISAQSDELKVGCGLRERRRCVIALLAGTSGSGKSTLASILAMRLGITTVVSTDSLRHMLRSFQGREEAPLLWASTYQAGETLEGEGISESERLLLGYKAQCELLLEPLDRLIGQCIQRNQSLICEGVHLAVPFVLMLMQKYPSILPFLVYIKSEAKHTERMAVRAKYMTLDPHKNKYVKYMGNIRGIQDYLVRKADKHLFPKIENSNIDRSVGVIHLTIMGCLRRAMKGEPALDAATNTARMPHSEHCAVLDNLASTSNALRAAGAAANAAASDASGSFASGSFVSGSNGFASSAGGSYAGSFASYFSGMSDPSGASAGFSGSGFSGVGGSSGSVLARQLKADAAAGRAGMHAGNANAAATSNSCQAQWQGMQQTLQQEQQQRQQQQGQGDQQHQQQVAPAAGFAASSSNSSAAHSTFTFTPAANEGPMPITGVTGASGSSGSGSREGQQGLWPGRQAEDAAGLPFQLLPTISAPRNSSPGYGDGDEWLTAPSSPLAAEGLSMRTLHHHNHQGPGPYDHGAGSEFLLYPAGQLLSSDDEAAAGGASPRGSSADGSEDGTNFIQEYGSVAESTTADEWDDGEDGHGLRAWNGGMSRALWGPPSWRHIPSRAASADHHQGLGPSAAHATPGAGATGASGLQGAGLSGGLGVQGSGLSGVPCLGRASSGRSEQRGDVPLPYSERGARGAGGGGSSRSTKEG